ncbi:hypothetical protein LzC2_08320 [Planctomycetes bacterium LzC2]|uniref:DUF3035 domain-containing protein n=2 Tax=Alienimonas chondri TaxID=2681879 RepID=A0ABX1VA69_9PLAN|nr:hypothetical protein [Alienimonas chondri]
MMLGGCGLPRYYSPRPDYDLPMGFSGTYRFALVQAGEVPAGPTDREALSRLQLKQTPAGPFPPSVSKAAPAVSAAEVDAAGAVDSPSSGESGRPVIAEPVFPLETDREAGPEASESEREAAGGPLAMLDRL